MDKTNQLKGHLVITRINGEMYLKIQSALAYSMIRLTPDVATALRDKLNEFLKEEQT